VGKFYLRLRAPCISRRSGLMCPFEAARSERWCCTFTHTTTVQEAGKLSREQRTHFICMLSPFIHPSLQSCVRSWSAHETEIVDSMKRIKSLCNFASHGIRRARGVVVVVVVVTDLRLSVSAVVVNQAAKSRTGVGGVRWGWICCHP
jgi:hypothetical protein